MFSELDKQRREKWIEDMLEKVINGQEEWMEIQVPDNYMEKSEEMKMDETNKIEGTTSKIKREISKDHPEYKKLLKEGKIYVDTGKAVSAFGNEPVVFNKVGKMCFGAAGILVVALIIVHYAL